MGIKLVARSMLILFWYADGEAIIWLVRPQINLTIAMPNAYKNDQNLIECYTGWLLAWKYEHRFPISDPLPYTNLFWCKLRSPPKMLPMPWANEWSESHRLHQYNDLDDTSCQLKLLDIVFTFYTLVKEWAPFYAGCWLGFYFHGPCST